MEKKSRETETSQQEFIPISLVPGELLMGYLVQVDALGQAWVNLPQLPNNPYKALSTTALKTEMQGRQVAISFINGDIHQPIVLGVIHSALDHILQTTQDAAHEQEDISVFHTHENSTELPQPTVSADGKRITFEAQEEIQLRCGESSITLTKAGKIILRGKYLLSRSSGVNRILGGSVQIN